MKKLLILLLLLPSLLQAQHLYNNRWVVGPGEYINGIVDLSNKRLYQLVELAQHLGSTPDSFVEVRGGAHHIMARTVGGRLYAWGDNGNGELGDGTTTSRINPTLIATDSLGNQIINVVKVWPGGYHGWNSSYQTGDGKLFRCGDLQGGNRGNGTYGSEVHKFVQVPLSAGVVVQDMLCSDIAVILDTAGNVWTFGGENENNGNNDAYILAQGTSNPNRRTPTKINLPGRVKMIAGGFGNWNYALLTDGRLYAWSPYLKYCGISGNADMSTIGYNPFRVDTALNHYLTAPIDTIVTNSMFTAVILTDSTIWGWGSNACANLGAGAGIDYRHYHTPGGTYSPYAWDQGNGEAMQITPVQMMKGKHNFTKLFSGTSIVFYFMAEDVHDSLFVTGRNKGGVGGDNISGVDSVAGDLQSAFPNNWDINYWKYINPFVRNFVIRTTCQWYIDTTNALLQSKYPINTSGSAPVANAGTDQTITNNSTSLKGTFSISSPARGLFERTWTCIQKPSGAPNPTLPLVENDTVPVSGLVLGTYQFRYAIRDNNFKTSADTVTINVTSGGTPPTVNAGVDQTISLPTTSVTLSGTATANGGATITSTLWTQISGPSTATIASPGSLTTAVTNLKTGVYTFQLSATDSNSNTSNDTMTITVQNCNCLVITRGHQILVK